MTITTLVLVNSLQRLLRLMKRCYGFRSARRLHKLCFRPRRKRRRRSTSHKLGLAPRLRSRDRGPKIVRLGERARPYRLGGRRMRWTGGTSSSHPKPKSWNPPAIRAGRGQLGPCPTDEAHRPLPERRPYVSRYAGARTLQQRSLRQILQVESFYLLCSRPTQLLAHI